MAVHGTPPGAVADTESQCGKHASAHRYLCQQADGPPGKVHTAEVTTQYLFSEPLQDTRVKAYLVGKGIASNRVQTSARGETQPSTFAGECKDANNAKNKACMQPDRHVFIEVSGSRIAK